MNVDPASRDPFASYLARMDAVGFRPSRRLGQNFLLDAGIHRAVADAAEVGPSDVVLEVGGGLGFLTRELAARSRKVVVVEVDRRLQQLLGQEIARFPAGGAEVVLIGSDVLDRGALAPAVSQSLRISGASSSSDWVVAANLPYAIAGPFLVALLESELTPPRQMGLLVQTEFADRIAAAPGTRDYGGPSLVLQTLYEARRARTVAAAAFRPRPNVGSAILALRLRGELPECCRTAIGRRRFIGFVRRLFGHRRKVLRGVLEELWGAPLSTAPAEVQLAGRRRAGELGAAEAMDLFMQLAASRSADDLT